MLFPSLTMFINMCLTSTLQLTREGNVSACLMWPRNTNQSHVGVTGGKRMWQ